LIFLIVALISIFSVALVYYLYYKLIFGDKEKSTKFLENLKEIVTEGLSSFPNVTILVPAFNESRVIQKKLENIAELDYPVEKIEVIVIDDGSDDDTSKIAKDTIGKLHFDGKIIKNQQRMGVNATLNRGIQQARNDLICITDSDVTLERESLRYVISVLEKMEDVGGATGNIVPSFGDSKMVTGLEGDYRDFSNRSMLVESFRHSAFPGSTVLTVLRRSKLANKIPVEYGSSDGNISISLIRNGSRFIYVPFADVYEPVPDDLSQHRLQKIRRAKRLIQVVTHNFDVLFNKKYGEFGSIIFPLKFAMFVCCPLFIFVGLISLVFFVLLSNNIILYALSIFSVSSIVFLINYSKRFRDLFLGFVLHQFYCLIGFFLSFRKGTSWKKIERKSENIGKLPQN
jgi:biofilm PGA synthesis N-glycosyltransferase PgaC